MKTFTNLMILVASAAIFISASASDGTPQEQYVARYAAIAVSEMYRTGVPASITLAQGLLESRYGQSFLAADGNNHFGIKCHDWTGKKQYADDDKKGECFRVYDSAEESFHDHSDFLRYRDRYKFLFDYETTDYQSWAYGLKKAGYATDPAYPAKLIKLIEDYGLSKYDKMSVKQAEKVSDEVKPSVSHNNSSVSSASTKEPRKAEKPKKTKRTRSKSQSSPLVDDTQVTIVESPGVLEAAKVYEPSESFSFSLSRKMFSLNGVPFIYAVEGETLESIASANKLFVKELVKFNDYKAGKQPEAGEIVYLQAKKKQTAKGLDKYIADEGGETLWEVSQRFGVKLSELCKRNSLTKDYVLREGDSILLR